MSAPNVDPARIMRKLTNWNEEKDDTDGLEVLQTDIMRFMAIIGFCLLAIFALVKSVQSTSPPNSDGDRQIDAMVKQLEQQQRHSSELKRQNQLLQRQLALTEQQFQRQLDAQVRSVKKQPERVVKSVVQPVPPVRAVTPAPVKVVKTKPKPEPKLQPLPEAVATSTERPVKTAVRKPVKKGYSLRFSDDQALLTLLDAGQIKVVAIAGDQIYQAKNINGHRVFVLKNSDFKSYHQLFDDIPESLQKAWTVQYGQRDPNYWGVVLPESIVTRIKLLMGEYQAGEFSIDNQGRVMHRDF